MALYGLQSCCPDCHTSALAANAQECLLIEDSLNAAGANGLASLMLQCLWESFALPVIVDPLVVSQQADAPRQQTRSKPKLQTVLRRCNVLAERY